VKRIGGTVAIVLLGAVGWAVLAPGPSDAKTSPSVPSQILGTTTVAPATTAKPATTSTPATTAKPATTTTAVRSTTTGATTSTSSTVVTIPGGGAPPPVTAPPSTIPLTTHESNGHVSPVFPALGIAGLVAVVAMLGVQWFLTRPDRHSGWTL
jgi:cobalamin biosynthesis Mg chelatase CobN